MFQKDLGLSWEGVWGRAVLDQTSHVTPIPPQPVPQGSPQFPGLGEGLDEHQTQWWGPKGPRE